MPDPISNQTRFGIAEWYGSSFLGLTDDQRLQAAKAALKRKRPPNCPFQTPARRCGKAGGVCSIRAYTQGVGGEAEPLSNHAGAICITCPHRFKVRNSVFEWVGETLLGDGNVVNLGEIGFLERIDGQASSKGRTDVGRIDNILVLPGSEPLRWCALETQAVYFSGKKMATEFNAIRRAGGKPVFPLERRRPDFRSSGPKRLMPQLQTKVPTLRRWGIKTAIVVDHAFFSSLSTMKPATELTSADLAWFVVDTPPDRPDVELRRCEVFLSTLEEAVDGLTAGLAVGKPVFEDRIREKVRAMRLS